jgi:hypothetical protein
MATAETCGEREKALHPLSTKFPQLPPSEPQKGGVGDGGSRRYIFNGSYLFRRTLPVRHADSLRAWEERD